MMETNESNEMSAQERRELKKEYQAQKKQKASGSSGLIWGAVVVVLIIGGFILMRMNANNNNNVTDKSPLEVTENDHVSGPEDALVTMVEYGDFQCPACGFYADMVKQLGSDFPDQLQIAYRHFPLTSVHLNAVPSALASEAAANQGKFWEMYDLLYTRQDDWSTDTDPTQKFVSYAGEIGLDIDRFRQDLENQAGLPKIQSDLDTAQKLRLNSTPSFFVNGESFRPTAGTYEELKSYIETKISSTTDVTSAE